MEDSVCALRPDERIDLVNDDLSLIQNTRFFRFGTDALLLAGFIDKRPRPVAAELGAGSGIVSLLCAARGRFRQIHAVELQPYFADLTARNAERNGLHTHITVHCDDVQNLTSAQLGGEMDAVFTNPPYMTADCGKQNTLPENRLARHESTADIVSFSACAARLLKHGGSFYVVYRPDRLTDLLYAMRKNALEPKKMTFVLPCPSAPPSLVLVHAKCGRAAGGLRLTAPFIIYRDSNSSGQREYSKEMLFLLESGRMEI